MRDVEMPLPFAFDRRLACRAVLKLNRRRIKSGAFPQNAADETAAEDVPVAQVIEAEARRAIELIRGEQRPVLFRQFGRPVERADPDVHRRRHTSSLYSWFSYAPCCVRTFIGSGVVRPDPQTGPNRVRRPLLEVSRRRR